MSRRTWCLLGGAWMFAAGCNSPGSGRSDPFAGRPQPRVTGAQPALAEARTPPGSPPATPGYAHHAQYTFEPPGTRRGDAVAGDLGGVQQAEARTAARGPQPGVLEANAADYSWVQGRLDYTRMAGGIWRVRYGSLSGDDPHGGCVILQTDPTAQGFKAGDIVYAEGRIVEDTRFRQLRNPTYEVTRMVRVDAEPQ
jgi:hypothetical protein